jgi:uncharacterized membrane protein
MSQPDGSRPVRGSAQADADPPWSADDAGVAGNERLTALAGAVLLVLTVVALVIAANVRTLMSAHVFAGVLLAGPLTVKIGSTGYLVLLPLLAIHVSAHIRQVPRLIADDWRLHLRVRVPGRGRRLGVVAGSLVAAAIAAVLVHSGATPLIASSKGNAIGPLPVIAGVLVAALTLAARRALRRYLPRPRRADERNSQR